MNGNVLAKKQFKLLTDTSKDYNPDFVKCAKSQLLAPKFKCMSQHLQYPLQLFFPSPFKSDSIVLMLAIPSDTFSCQVS